MTPIKVFMVELTGTIRVEHVFTCDACDHVSRDHVRDVRGVNTSTTAEWTKVITCKCGDAVKLSSISSIPYYRRVDTGELVGGKSRLPAGACYDATWLHHLKPHCGPDGRSLHVVLPDGHHWNIDGRASNCSLLADTTHKCWVRHGSPESGDLHVDKDGITCAAGAGSIATDRYHGFLHRGHLTEC